MNWKILFCIFEWHGIIEIAQQQVSGFLKNLVPIENEKNSFFPVHF